MLWSETNFLYLVSEGKISIIDPSNLTELYSKKVNFI